VVPRRFKPSFRYELVVCAIEGHELVGTDAAAVVAGDRSFVREIDDRRWHRCLRCDDWLVLPRPEHPARAHAETRDEVVLPARGVLLRDKLVLRLIAVDRAVHVVVFGLLAVALFTFAANSKVLHRDYLNIMNDLSGGDPGSTQARGLLGYFSRVFSYSSAHLVRLGLIVTAYAILAAVEMVGLWRTRRWAEYLTAVAVALFIPIEILELSKGISAFKVIAFVVNIVVLTYLLFAKRLFGLRGGYAAERARRESLSGWASFDAVDAGLPGIPSS
jgi:uncharacterized membrane protein (DUF2068 family)